VPTIFSVTAILQSLTIHFGILGVLILQYPFGHIQVHPFLVFLLVKQTGLDISQNG
jgi:hypothetical protein